MNVYYYLERMLNNKCIGELSMNKQILDRRVIVVDTTTMLKYTMPNNSDAAFLMGGTTERVRQKLAKDSGRLLYDKYRVFHYTEEKYQELSEQGYADGEVYKALRPHYEKLLKPSTRYPWEIE